MHTSTHFHRVQQRGFTLLELLISASLGIFLLAGLATLFVQGNRSYRQNELVTAMQDQARFTLKTMSQELMAAGFWGGITDPAAIGVGASTTALDAADDCGTDSGASWAFDAGRRIEFLNNATASSLAAAHHCISTADFLEGTDVIAVRRAASQVTNAMTASDISVTLRPYTFYLQTNGVAGSLIRTGASSTYTPAPPNLPLSAPMRFYKFRPRIYYVRDWAFSTGDGVPSLCRMELQHIATASMTSECLGIGVQNLQLTWGLDTDDDDFVDRYKTAPTAAELDDALTVRIEVLMRSRDQDRNYENRKSYSLGDAGHDFSSAPDGYLRRIYSTTVQLRNRYW